MEVGGGGEESFLNATERSVLSKAYPEWLLVTYSLTC